MVTTCPIGVTGTFHQDVNLRQPLKFNLLKPQRRLYALGRLNSG